jgi:hypothetical protein
MRKIIGDGNPSDLAKRYKRILSLESGISYVRGYYN